MDTPSTDIRNQPPEWLTIDELATYLQIKKKLIYHWRVEGRGPRATKVGRALRYHRDEVRNWLTAQTESTVGSDH